MLIFILYTAAILYKSYSVLQHVILSGNAWQKIFFDDDNCEQFLGRLETGLNERDKNCFA